MRRVVGVVRIVAGLGLLGTIVFQIADQVAHHGFVPGQYFAYFTIQTALLDVAMLLVGGAQALRRPRDTRALTTVAMCVVVYAVITTVVYNALLRGIPQEGYDGPDWINEVLHVVIPALLILDWLLAPGRHRLRLRAFGWALLYPAAWLVFTMTRGAIDGWYPYPFLEPGGPNGVAGVVAYVVGLGVAIGLLASAAAARTLIGRPVPRSGR